MILFDTTIWSLALRRRREDLSHSEGAMCRVLEEAAHGGRAQLLGIVRLEVLSGIRDRAQYERLRSYLSAFDDIPLSSSDYEEAAAMSNTCREVGIVGASADFLICAVAVRRDWEIFTADRDFEQYGKHLPLRLLGLA
jgi:predicted nucleic acid-binding protein